MSAMDRKQTFHFQRKMGGTQQLSEKRHGRRQFEAKPEFNEGAYK